MKYYRYKVLDKNKKIFKGVYKANSINELINKMKKKDLFILDCKEMNKPMYRFKKKLSIKEIHIICEEFYQLIKSGISLTEVLRLCSIQNKNKYISHIISNLFQKVSEGESLYSAMKSFDNIFPSFMMCMIKIGEESGNLEQVFCALSKHYYHMNKFKNKIKKAMAYPILILVVSFLAMLLLRIKAIPVFINMITDIGGEVPVSTKVFIFLFDKGVIFLSVFIAICFICYKFHLDLLEKFKFKNLVLSKYIFRWEEIKFIKSIGILINSGVDIISSMETIIQCTNSTFLSKKYKEALNNLKKGNSLYKSLEPINIFQNVTISMIAMGEFSGNLDKVLNNIQEVLNNELNHKIDKITEIIEPIFIIIISIFIGFIIISAIMPIINMTSYIGI